jgi:glycosyltransferase involved in cell wall biosynthesis
MSVVAVVTSSPPFVEGGHLVIARGLVQALRADGHETDLILTPQNRFGRQGAAYAATWLTDVGRTHDGRDVDQVISLRYPSYAVRHPRHVCWLLHTMREYYDQWDAFSRPLSWKGRIKEQTRRRLVWAADRYLLRHHVKRLFVISATVQRRLQRFVGVSSDVLYPPPPPRPYRVDAYDPYLFAVSRFTPLKRMALIVEALARPQAAGIRAVLAGEGEQHAEIARLVRDRGLADRVTLPGRLDEPTLVDHLARCRAVVFPPFDEDYGFVTVEAFASAKPVVTCTDSGGPAELVVDGANGLVAAPEPDALARAFRLLIDDQQTAATMGEAGAARAAQLTWPDTVRRLLLPVH